MRRVRDRIYRLLDRRLWPREQTDLYFLLGCLNGLMGITANRLGYPDAAEELIRAGWAYANAIDHNGRCAACCARGSPTSCTGAAGIAESRDLAADGLRYASRGPGRRQPAPRARPRRWPGSASRRGPPGGRPRARRLGGPRLQRRPAGDRRRGVRPLAGHPPTPWPEPRSPRPATGARRAGELERAISLYDQGPRPGEQHGFAGQGAGRHRPGHRPAAVRARWTPQRRHWSRSWPCRPASGSPRSPPGWPRSAVSLPRRSSGTRRRPATSATRSRSSAARPITTGLHSLS